MAERWQNNRCSATDIEVQDQCAGENLRTFLRSGESRRSGIMLIADATRGLQVRWVRISVRAQVAGAH